MDAVVATILEVTLPNDDKAVRSTYYISIFLIIQRVTVHLEFTPYCIAIFIIELTENAIKAAILVFTMPDNNPATRH